MAHPMLDRAHIEARPEIPHREGGAESLQVELRRIEAGALRDLIATIRISLSVKPFDRERAVPQRGQGVPSDSVALFGSI
jgi:hypothetical protein